MNERRKSDSPVVPAKPPNKAMAAAAVRRWWRKGGWPRGTRTAQHVPDAVPGQACQAGWIVCAK